MKDIIKEVLTADEQARNKLAMAENEKDNIALNISEKKPLINEHYMDEAKVKLEEYKQSLDQGLQDHRNKLRVQYEQTGNEIRNQFSTNKDRWIQAIYERCIQK